MMWIARARYPDLEPDRAMAALIPDPKVRRGLEESFGFLWRLRHALHLVEGKRNDRLGESYQDEVARMMGFENREGGNAAEGLMSTYYQHAQFIHIQCERALEKIRRELFPPSRIRRWISRRRIGQDFVRTEHGTLDLGATSAPKASRLMPLRLFAVAKHHRLAVDARAKDLAAAALRSSAGGSSGPTLWEEEAAIWRDIFSSLAHLNATLSQMQECGVLEHYFPEMRPMIHRVQHDGFHSYTAGVHSIHAIGELAALLKKEGRRKFPTTARAMRLVKRPHVLAVATLFHDVGKGREGDHVAIGARLAAGIARRLGFSQRDTADIVFLVRSHLLMSVLAFRRDVRDPGLVERFTQVLRSHEMLAMLYLLTFADLRSVGPHVWSEWKGGLLDELYRRARSCLDEGGMTPARIQREKSRRIKAAGVIVGRKLSVSEVEEFVTSLPERYILSMSPEAIAAHVMMSRQLEEIHVSTLWRQVPRRGCTEISVVTRDAPGLFAKIAGVLTANGANIIDAQLYTSERGQAIDVFWVTDPTHRPLNDPEVLSRIRQEMEVAITGKVDVDRIVEGRFRRRLLSWTRRPPQVTVDNDVSALETVVEVQADDRRGLLYAIACVFHELGLTIDRARITTLVDRVIDVFYIRDRFGEKITSSEQLDLLRGRLLEAIEG
jgi:[protein-PII] uridylyltransferase